MIYHISYITSSLIRNNYILELHF